MCRLFFDTLSRYRQRGAFALHSFVLMPDHFHVLLTPHMTKFRARRQLIKGGAAHTIGKERQLQFRSGNEVSPTIESASRRLRRAYPLHRTKLGSKEAGRKGGRVSMVIRRRFD